MTEKEKREIQTSDLQKIIDRAAMELGEHCVCIRIIISVDIEGQRISALMSSGAGNYHAQYGAVEKWLKREDNFDLAFELGD